MALRVTDVQGVKVYLAPKGSDVSTIENVETAIASAKQVDCLQALGSIAATRATVDYSCMSSDEVAFSLGSVTYSDQSIEVLFDAQDTTGKKDLMDAWENKERRQLIIALNDKPNENTGSSPTYITYEIGISGQEITLEKDGAVRVTSTCKPTKPKLFRAVAA